MQVAVAVSRREGGDGFFESLQAGLIFGWSQPSQLLEGPKQQRRFSLASLASLPRPPLVRLHTAVWLPLRGKKSFERVALLGLVKERWLVAATFSRSQPDLRLHPS